MNDFYPDFVSRWPCSGPLNSIKILQCNICKNSTELLKRMKMYIQYFIYWYLWEQSTLIFFKAQS